MQKAPMVNQQIYDSLRSNPRPLYINFNKWVWQKAGNVQQIFMPGDHLKVDMYAIGWRYEHTNTLWRVLSITKNDMAVVAPSAGEDRYIEVYPECCSLYNSWGEIVEFLPMYHFIEPV